ncbi:MAG: hypothetical protein AAGC55_24440 [Myxococcota bacterium]
MIERDALNLIGTPIHNAMGDSPTIELGGYSATRSTSTARASSFITADMTRTLILGPSSLPLSAGTPWFGGTQSKLLALADCCGQPGAVGVEASLALRTIAHYVAGIMPWLACANDGHSDTLAAELHNAMESCKLELRAASYNLGAQNGAVGAAITVAYISWPDLYVVHYGRSRAYLLRDARLYRLGEAEPRASSSDTPERGPGEPHHETRLHRSRIMSGDQLLLATDSLLDRLSESHVAEEIHDSPTAQLACHDLIEAARRADSDDSVSVALARVVSPRRAMLRWAESHGVSSQVTPLRPVMAMRKG